MRSTAVANEHRPAALLTAEGIRRGLRATVPMGISVATYGVVFGILARQVGVTMSENILMNVFVFAGAAQTAALDQWSYPLPIFSIVMTVLLINLRLLLLGASVRPWIGALPPGKAYPLLHILFDEGWAIAMNARRHGERDIGFFVGCNLAVGIAWLPAVVVGHLAGGELGDPAVIGLDFAFTTVFAAMLFGGYRGRFDLLPWSASAICAMGGYWLLPGTWYVLLGGIAGFAVGAWRGTLSRGDAAPGDVATPS
ncbi:MAG TPA: AzlC family ABC transporter permease [Thermomicrobiales bacterium]|nr:AzlC family ABC transporter permease [Thermomicrobiales bacterium]